MQVVGVRHHLSARIYLVRFCLYVAREMGHGICTNQEMIDYSILLKNNSFWKRGANMQTELSLQTPMKHREHTICRFALLKM